MNHDQLRVSSVSSWSPASRIRRNLLSGRTLQECHAEKQMSLSEETSKESWRTVT